MAKQKKTQMVKERSLNFTKKTSDRATRTQLKIALSKSGSVI
jgi:hypothetical protein